MQGSFAQELLSPGTWIAFALLLTFSYWHLRHVGLAVLTVVCPLPGFLGAVWLGGHESFLGYLAGFVAANFIGSAIAANAAAHAAPRGVRDAMRTFGPTLLAALVLVTIAPLFAVFRGKGLDAITLAPSVATIAAGACAMILLPLGAALLPYDENFVVRTNRTGERRQRWLGWIVPVAQPRWGWSIGGIVLVFSILGFFGLRDRGGLPALDSQTQFLLPAAAFLIFALSYIATRNLRRTMAVLLAVVPLVLLTMWALAKAAVAIPAPELLLVLGMALMPVVIMAARASAFARQGDGPTTATIRALEEIGAAVVFTSIMVALAIAAFHALAAAAFIEEFALLLGGVAALIVQPALSTMLYALFPERVPLDARYRLP